MSLRAVGFMRYAADISLSVYVDWFFEDDYGLVDLIQ